jgi:hypothetical protein
MLMVLVLVLALVLAVIMTAAVAVRGERIIKVADTYGNVFSLRSIKPSVKLCVHFTRANVS